MAISVGEVEATIKLRDEFSAGIDQMRSRLAAMESDLEKRAVSAAANLTSQANDLATMMASPVVRFQQAMGEMGAKAEGAIEGLVGSQLNLVGMLSRYLGPAAVGAAVLKTAEWADSLSEMSVATGIGTEKLQQMAYVAQLNGSSFEGLVRGITMMESRLAGGDKSAVSALNKLGLSFDAIEMMAPEKMLETIAAALANVADADDRVRIAKDLLGRSGMMLLPTLLALNEEMGNAPVVADELVQTMGQLADVWAGAKIQGQALLATVFAPLALFVSDPNFRAIALGQVGPGRLLFGGLPGAPAPATSAGTRPKYDPRRPLVTGTSGFEALIPTVIGPGSAAEWERLLGWQAKSKEELRANALATSQAAAATRKLDDEWRRLGTKEVKKDITDLSNAIGENARAWYQMLDVVDEALSKVPEASHEFANLKIDLGVGPPSQAGVSITERASWLTGPGGVLSQLPQTILGSLMGGGNLGESIGSLLGGGIGTKLSSMLGDTLKKTLGDTIGGMLGSILPGIGSLLGPAVGWLAGKIGGLFPSIEGEKTQQARGTWLQQMGAQFGAGGVNEFENYQAIMKHAQEIGKDAVAALEAVYKAGDRKTLEANIARLEAEFKKFDEAVKKLTSDLTTLSAGGGLLNEALLKDIKKYGGTTEGRAALGQFLTTETQRAVGGLGAFAETGVPVTAAGAVGLGGAAALLFRQMQAQGLGMAEILQQMSPILDNLSKQFEKAGVSGGEAFTQILNLSKYAADEGVKNAATAVQGLGDVMTGLYNIGLLDQETFSGLTDQVAATFEKLTGEGKGGEDALRLMQPTLQKIWELHEKGKLEVNENVQGLLDMAEAAGLVGEEFKSAADQMVDAINALIERLGILLDQMFPGVLGETGEQGPGGPLEGGEWSEQRKETPPWRGGWVTGPNGERYWVPAGGEGEGEGGIMPTGQSLPLPISGEGMTQTVIVNLDGQTITRVVAKNLPRVLALEGGTR